MTDKFSAQAPPRNFARFCRDFRQGRKTWMVWCLLFDFSLFSEKKEPQGVHTLITFFSKGYVSK